MQHPYPFPHHHAASMSHPTTLQSLFPCTPFGIFCCTCQAPIDFHSTSVVNHCRYHHHYHPPLPFVCEFLTHTKRNMTVLANTHPLTSFLRSPRSIHFVEMCCNCRTIATTPCCDCRPRRTTTVQAYITVCCRYVRAEMVQQHLQRLQQQPPQQESSIVEQRVVVPDEEEGNQQQITTTTSDGGTRRVVEKVITADEFMQLELPLKGRVFVAL